MPLAVPCCTPTWRRPGPAALTTSGEAGWGACVVPSPPGRLPGWQGARPRGCSRRLPAPATCPCERDSDAGIMPNAECGCRLHSRRPSSTPGGEARRLGAAPTARGPGRASTGGIGAPPPPRGPQADPQPNYYWPLQRPATVSRLPKAAPQRPVGVRETQRHLKTTQLVRPSGSFSAPVFPAGAGAGRRRDGNKGINWTCASMNLA
jgi:hypothetical protein